LLPRGSTRPVDEGRHLHLSAASGKLKHTHFANTVIRSVKRMTIKQAYALMFRE